MIRISPRMKTSTLEHSTPPSNQLPAAIRATGFAPPQLYQRLLTLGLHQLAPWELVSGEAFLELYQQVNDSLNAEGRAQLVVPFAVREDRGDVACFRAVPASPQVLLYRSAQGASTLLPDLSAWLRLALEDLIASVDTPSSAPRPAGETAALAASAVTSESRSSTRRHLMRVLRESDVDLSFVSIEAGDQALTSASLRREHEQIKRERGEQLYTDMLFVLTQHRYPARMAKWLWARILWHKQQLGKKLGRNVEITVASLDYLNGNEHLIEGSLVLCSEDELAQAADVALRDGLTGLFDQATFKARTEREIERMRRYGGSLSLVMLDLDHFKRLNDEHGHLEGDRVLADLGALLSQEARGVDLVARYGGEEFALLLPETETQDAVQLAERIRRAVKQAFAHTTPVTVSLGVASFPADAQRATDLIEAADQALYRAKRNGRDQTRCTPRWPTSAE